MILTDTCIFIELFKENLEVVHKIDEIGARNIVLNSIIVMELLAGARNKIELNSLKKRLNNYRIVEINQGVMDCAEELLENYGLSHGLKIPDAIIAATALYHDIMIFTYNKKDFRFISELKIL